MTTPRDDQDDEIVAEVRRHRQAHAAKFGYDLELIVKDIQRQEREAGTPVVTRPPRKPVAVQRRKSA